MVLYLPADLSLVTCESLALFLVVSSNPQVSPPRWACHLKSTHVARLCRPSYFGLRFYAASEPVHPAKTNKPTLQKEDKTISSRVVSYMTRRRADFVEQRETLSGLLKRCCYLHKCRSFPRYPLVLLPMKRRP